SRSHKLHKAKSKSSRRRLESKEARQSRRLRRLRRLPPERLKRPGATSFTSKRRIFLRECISTRRRFARLQKGCAERKATCSQNQPRSGRGNSNGYQAIYGRKSRVTFLRISKRLLGGSLRWSSEDFLSWV